MTTETARQAAGAEFVAGHSDGGAEALNDGWTRETFTAWCAQCGPVSSEYDRGFRAGVDAALTERGQ